MHTFFKAVKFCDTKENSNHIITSLYIIPVDRFFFSLTAHCTYADVRFLRVDGYYASVDGFHAKTNWFHDAASTHHGTASGYHGVACRYF